MDHHITRGVEGEGDGRLCYDQKLFSFLTLCISVLAVYSFFFRVFFAQDLFGLTIAQTLPPSPLKESEMFFTVGIT